MNNRTNRVSPLVCVLAMFLGTAPVAADVTIEEKLRVEGSGLMSMMNMNGTSVTRIAGDRARTDMDMQMESRMMRMVGGFGPTAEIVRLDQERMISLDLNDQTYSEATFAEQRAEMERAMAEMRQSQQAQQQGMSGIDESECDWSEATASVERSGETATIAGYRAERLLLTSSQSCRIPESGEVCDFGIRLEQWIAPEFESGSEVMGFYQEFARQMGLDTVGSRGFTERAEMMFGGYKGVWETLAAHMQTLEGYPVKSSISLAIGGPQCESIKQLGSMGSATSGLGQAIGGALGGRLGGMLGRKRDDSAKPKAPDAPTDSMVSLMTISNELVSVSRGAVGAETFEVPAGFRPVAR